MAARRFVEECSRQGLALVELDDALGESEPAPATGPGGLGAEQLGGGRGPLDVVGPGRRGARVRRPRGRARRARARRRRRRAATRSGRCWRFRPATGPSWSRAGSRCPTRSSATRITGRLLARALAGELRSRRRAFATSRPTRTPARLPSLAALRRSRPAHLLGLVAHPDHARRDPGEHGVGRERAGQHGARADDRVVADARRRAGCRRRSRSRRCARRRRRACRCPAGGSAARPR